MRLSVKGFENNHFDIGDPFKILHENGIETPLHLPSSSVEPPSDYAHDEGPVYNPFSTIHPDNSEIDSDPEEDIIFEADIEEWEIPTSCNPDSRRTNGASILWEEAEDEEEEVQPDREEPER
ncbi:hypothetical protein K440DRAFT_644052 [Wilcoxina mikolae CBS 423.85]|nr:hypothetical protein K440DRAFT_644052 [Wilcoxina mikolae CBS 423.85]